MSTTYTPTIGSSSSRSTPDGFGNQSSRPKSYEAQTTANVASTPQQRNTPPSTTTTNAAQEPRTTLVLDDGEYFESRTESITILLILFLSIITTIGYYIFGFPSLAMYLVVFLGLLVLLTAVVAKIIVRQNPGLGIGAFLLLLIATGFYGYFIYWSYFTFGSVSSDAIEIAQAEQTSDGIVISFSKPVDRSEVEELLIITPTVAGRYEWSKPSLIPLPLWNQATFVPENELDQDTAYQVTVAGSEDIFGQDFEQEVVDVLVSEETPAEENPQREPEEATTREIISRISPENGETDVAQESEIVINFSLPVNQETFELQVSPQVQTEDLVWNNDSTAVTITPNSDLEPETQYTITITQGLAPAEEALDEAIAESYVLQQDFTSQFTTISEFALEKVSPMDGDTDVALNTELLFFFNQDLETNFTEENYSITPTIELTPQIDGANLTFTPNQDFSAATQYTLTITGLTSRDGEQLEQDLSLSFTTAEETEEEVPEEEEPTIQPLTLQNSTPSNNEIEVLTSSTIVFTFDQALADNQSTNLVTITPNIESVITIAEDQITLRPTSSLNEGTTYTVSVNQNLTSVVGNTLENDLIIFFTTEQPEETPPEEPEEEQPQQPSQSTIEQAGYTQRTDLEDEIIRLINQQRTASGREAVNVDPGLEKVTEEYALDLAQNGFRDTRHTDSQSKDLHTRLEEAGYNQAIYSEGIYLYLSFDAPSVVNAWLNRDNRLRTVDFDLAGATVVQKPDGTFAAVFTTVDTES